MTNGEPPEEPDGEETEGIEQPSIPGFRLPETPHHHHHLHLQAHRNLLRQANRKPSCSCPKAWTWTTALNLRVWTVNGTTMRLIIARRC